ncbi:mannose-1-phosphate guanylyltransferase [archaeon]|nr:mannose-1-phosphate guanylyltransferase [archaeon]
MRVHAVIMAGGKGERLWPVSQSDMPKQLHSFGADKSLLRMTFERISALTDSENIYVVTNAEIAHKVHEQLPELPEENILAEPVGRNTAPCIAYAARVISLKDPEAVMAVFPADHLIGNTGKFIDSIVFGLDSLVGRPELLITLGIVPDHPETGYGYIAPGEVIDRDGNMQLHRVITFHEKPDSDKAGQYISKGFLWNAGMFIWRVDTILESFRKHLPIMFGQIMSLGHCGEISRAELEEFYRTVDPVSIDYGVMEKASSVGVIPAEFGWNDIGSWDALAKILPGDAEGNTIRGDVILDDSFGNLVWSGGKKIVLIGVNDLVVVETDESILVCPRSSSQHVSRIAKKLMK